ncbi:hypothetical protein GCM10020331_026690 [Ectobacillus funiculus]
MNMSEHFSSVIGVMQVDEEETHRYGVIDPVEQTGRRYQVRKFVEKAKSRNCAFEFGDYRALYF